MSQKEIADFMEKSQINEPATPEEFREAVLGAYKDRTRQIYFIWQIGRASCRERVCKQV